MNCWFIDTISHNLGQKLWFYVASGYVCCHYWFLPWYCLVVIYIVVVANIVVTVVVVVFVLTFATIVAAVVISVFTIVIVIWVTICQVWLESFMHLQCLHPILSISMHVLQLLQHLMCNILDFFKIYLDLYCC